MTSPLSYAEMRYKRFSRLNKLSDIRIPVDETDNESGFSLFDSTSRDSPVFDPPLPSAPEVSSLPMAAWILEHDGSSQTSDYTLVRAHTGRKKLGYITQLEKTRRGLERL